jgi:hypothetical protein
MVSGPMKTKFTKTILLLTILLLLALPGTALAQTYYFSLDEMTVNVYWNEDGTESIDYVMVFTNSTFADPIDFVDVGLPNGDYDRQSIFADVDGKTITDIEDSPYLDFGPALGLGANAIQPGETGTVHVFIGTVRNVLYPDDDDEDYVSAVFSPTWFDSKFLNGTTDLAVSFHLPPGVKPEEPRWHSAPSGFPSEPATSLDDQGRVTYTWINPSASATRAYNFGASFPAQYVPENAVVRPSPFAPLMAFFGVLLNCLPGIGFIGVIAFIIYAANRGSQQRKLQYLPPKISIEGHGIKRGLTSIEAAILLQEPMDKILTMILFATIKKEAATVVTRDPLKLEVVDPLPADMRDYEIDFLEAFKETKNAARRVKLQSAMTALVKGVANKMKGFSRKETVAYYKDIMERAWAQVEAADTPEVKSEKYNEVMEWTMLDKDYDERTRRTFSGGPVFVPMWWGRFDPTYSGGSTAPVSTGAGGGGGGGGISMPNLPGSDFAASVVNGTQAFAAGVIGNVTDFTDGITSKTNPPPPPSPSSSGSRGGGGGGCACACACAGCACACAGGGR